MRKINFLLLLLPPILVVFAPLVHHEFLPYDDNVHIYENPYLHPVTAGSLGVFWKGPLERLYMPMTYSLWALESYSSGEGESNPAIFHTVSIVLHSLNSILVLLVIYQILASMFPAKGKNIVQSASLAAALTFAIHPMQVETVAWVTSQKDLLSTFFFLCALWSFTKGMATNAISMRYRYGLTTLFFLLAVLSKASALVFPLVVAAIMNVIERRKWKEVVLRLLPWLFISIIIFIINMTEQNKGDAGFISPILLRPFLALDAFAFYLGKFIYPHPLLLEYGRSPTAVVEGGVLYLNTLISVALAVTVYKFRRKSPLLLLATLIFAACLLPVSGLVPFLFQKKSTVANRYAYLAMMGISLVPALLVLRDGTYLKRKWPLSLLVFILLGWMGKSIAQISLWGNTEALFRDNMEHNPRSELKNSLGVYLYKKGDREGAKQLFLASVKEDNPNPISHYNLGNYFAEAGEVDRAMEHFRISLQLDPNLYNAKLSLGKILCMRGRYDEGLGFFLSATKDNPLPWRAHLLMANALSKQKKLGESVAEYEKTIQINPRSFEALNHLGIALCSMGDCQRAIPHFKKALSLKPGDEAARSNLELAKAKRRNEGIVK